MRTHVWFTLYFVVVLPPIMALAEPPSMLESDWEEQYLRVEEQIADGVKGQPDNFFMLNDNAMIHDTDRDPLGVAMRRTKALLTHLQIATDVTELDALEIQLTDVEHRLAKNRNANEDIHPDELMEFYFEVRQIARKAAFLNPLMNFDRILFSERKCVGPGDWDGGHMTTAPFGHTQLYGGGLYVVSDFQTGNPSVVDVLKDSVVENGPSKGEQLIGGAYSSPELSYDGNEILFAYARPVYADKDRIWEYTEENSFHIFKVNVNGSHLVQLTHGNQNDFDPCYLPGGRIAFISTRSDSRGEGWFYPRCFIGRTPIQFFLHSMEPDGSDIIPLSYHETDEWQPSVNNDGMIVYTRWDYVDRNSNAAQHLWTCYPDGRDPRAPHGNYVHPFTTIEGSDFGPGVFTTRPCCEWHIRAIPHSTDYSGSSKYIATAGPHHGEPFGALVRIDTSIEDDGLMSQVKRITPNRFPESEVNSEASWDYATPWPLSEDFYLVNYWDGLYLLDKFGNHELICKGPNNALRPIEPIPLIARTTPPVIPTQTWQGRRATADAPQATVAVMNVYDGDLPWPEGTKLKELRIIQYFPKSTEKIFEPTIGYAEQSLARMVLGTVPIEEDGSVYFEAPIGKAISFQVLDEQGIAVQGMRSATYVHPGEQLTCVGCHESKWKSPSISRPIARQHPPSIINPEVGGLEPLNFHRLVAPVMREKCAGCHEEESEGPDMSYGSLQPYAFYLIGGKPSSGRWLTIPRHGGSRSVPGKHGAYGAPLLDYLDKSHYDVELTEEERRRITMWLDCNSNELGAYHDENAQRRGEIVWPIFDIDPTNPLGIGSQITPMQTQIHLE
jgi:hypothetical protein